MREVHPDQMLSQRDTLRIPGIHCFGNQAFELVPIGQAFMTQPAEADTLIHFVNATLHHPRLAKAYGAAALERLDG